jgi:polyhydroxybutyrate depolymerase
MRRCLLGLGVAAAIAACGGGDSTTIDADPNAPDADPNAPDADPNAPDAAPSGSCGTAAPTGRIDRTIVVDGTERDYILDVPAGYDPDRTYPVIFAWHGRTGTAALARAYFGIDDVVGSNALVIYPQGLPVTANPNDTGWELEANGRDVALFDAMLAEVQAEYCVGRIYSTGHSFGGYMSNSLGCFRGGSGPNDVRAIAPIAGGGPFGSCTGMPISAVVIHGMSDAVVPFSQGEGARDTWLAAAGCSTTSSPITPAPCVEYSGCTGGFSVRFCAHTETASSGHGWPSWAPGAAWDLFQASP